MFFGMFGGGDIQKRNRPVKIDAMRPDPRPMSSATGDAGRDGYTALATADRDTYERPMTGGKSVYQHPRGE